MPLDVATSEAILMNGKCTSHDICGWTRCHILAGNISSVDSPTGVLRPCTVYAHTGHVEQCVLKNPSTTGNNEAEHVHELHQNEQSG